MLLSAKDNRSMIVTVTGTLPTASSSAARRRSTASPCRFWYIRMVASWLDANARRIPGSIVSTATLITDPAWAVSPARKWFSADLRRRSGVSPPSPIARSTNSAAAAGAPRARAASAAWSSAVSISSSALAEASARCRALSSGWVSSSLSVRCMARRTLGPASVYTPLANRGWVKRTRFPSRVTMPSDSACSTR